MQTNPDGTITLAPDELESIKAIAHAEGRIQAVNAQLEWFNEREAARAQRAEAVAQQPDPPAPEAPKPAAGEPELSPAARMVLLEANAGAPFLAGFDYAGSF